MFKRNRRLKNKSKESIEDTYDEEIEEIEEIEDDVVIDIDTQDNRDIYEENVDGQEDKFNGPYILYMISDKVIPGMLEYTRNCGLKVTQLFSTIENSRNTMLMQYKPKRMIIIETGMGTFTATKARQELIDTISLADKESEVIVFYTSSVLKMDTIKSIGKNNKHVQWVEYKSMVDMIAKVLTLGEIYEYDDEIDSVNTVEEKYILRHKGKLDGSFDESNINIKDIETDTIISEVLESTESLIQFEPHI